MHYFYLESELSILETFTHIVLLILKTILYNYYFCI